MTLLNMPNVDFNAFLQCAHTFRNVNQMRRLLTFQTMIYFVYNFIDLKIYKVE